MLYFIVEYIFFKWKFCVFNEMNPFNEMNACWRRAVIRFLPSAWLTWKFSTLFGSAQTKYSKACGRGRIVRFRQGNIARHSFSQAKVISHSFIDRFVWFFFAGFTAIRNNNRFPLALRKQLFSFVGSIFSWKIPHLRFASRTCRVHASRTAIVASHVTSSMLLLRYRVGPSFEKWRPSVYF